MKDDFYRFGITAAAIAAAKASHGPGNPAIRSGMYVPTRNEVLTQPPNWLWEVLIDWLWECPSELIPGYAAVEELRACLRARADSEHPTIRMLIRECDDFLSTDQQPAL